METQAIICAWMQLGVVLLLPAILLWDYLDGRSN